MDLFPWSALLHTSVLEVATEQKKLGCGAGPGLGLGWSSAQNSKETKHSAIFETAFQVIRWKDGTSSMSFFLGFICNF